MNYTSLHCSVLSTRIKATVYSIRYFNWQENWIAFCPLFGNLCYVIEFWTPSIHKSEIIDILTLHQCALGLKSTKFISECNY